MKTQGFLTSPLAVCPEDLRRVAYPEAALWQDGHGRLRGWGLNRTFEAQRGFLSALQELWRDTATAKDAGAAQPGEALSGAFHGGWVAAHAAGQGRCIGKLILTRELAQRRGDRPVGDETPTRILARHEWPVAPSPAPVSPAMQGFRVAISSVRLGMNPLLAGLKHLNRLEQVLAQSAMRDAPLEEVLMLSSAGQVIGGSARPS